MREPWVLGQPGRLPFGVCSGREPLPIVVTIPCHADYSGTTSARLLWLLGCPSTHESWQQTGVGEQSWWRLSGPCLGRRADRRRRSVQVGMDLQRGSSRGLGGCVRHLGPAVPRAWCRRGPDRIRSTRSRCRHVGASCPARGSCVPRAHRGGVGSRSVLATQGSRAGLVGSLHGRARCVRRRTTQGVSPAYPGPTRVWRRRSRPSASPWSDPLEVP